MDEHDDLRARLRELGSHGIDPARRSADLVAIARVRPRSALLRSKARLATAFLAGLLIGSTGLAAADALPDPAQHVAHSVLSRVGVEVPNPARYHGAECGTDVKANHGAYVRDDHTLAKSECGKPVHADKSGDDADEPGDVGRSDGPGKDSCHGKPPWAGNKALTAEEKAAAEAVRAAECGRDAEDEATELEATEAEENDATTTTELPTTTTTESTVTTTTAPITSTSTTSAP